MTSPTLRCMEHIESYSVQSRKGRNRIGDVYARDEKRNLVLLKKGQTIIKRGKANKWKADAYNMLDLLPLGNHKYELRTQ